MMEELYTERVTYKKKMLSAQQDSEIQKTTSIKNFKSL